MDSSVLLAIGGGAIAVVFAVLLIFLVLREPPGNARMIEIASAIQEGATAYLNRQYTVIAVIGIVVAIVIGLTLGWVTAILYLVGAVRRRGDRFHGGRARPARGLGLVPRDAQP